MKKNTKSVLFSILLNNKFCNPFRLLLLFSLGFVSSSILHPALGINSSAKAQEIVKTTEIDRSALPALSLYKAMLDATGKRGWVQFRNYEGRQYIYFTPLQNLHCRLTEIRYSINSDELDKRFPIVPCNVQMPFALPPKTGPEAILLKLPLGTAKTVTVQVVWEDGQESQVQRYEPCQNVGDQTCAWPAK